MTSSSPVIKRLFDTLHNWLIDATLMSDGSLYFTKKRIFRKDKFEFHIYAKEHSPPHFHVVFGDADASFLIESGQLLMGDVSSKDLKIIEYWYKGSRKVLIDEWNKSRPLGCPVGRIESSS